VAAINRVQAYKAQADKFVIYRQEWFKGGAELGPYGLFHMNQIVAHLDSTPFAVVIQIDMDPALNEQRRAVVVGRLAAAGIPDPDSRVVVGFPQSEGLYGEEAERIYAQMLSAYNTNLYGTAFGLNVFPGFGAFGGGFGGFGGFGGLGGFGAFGGGFGGRPAANVFPGF
jgi:hypothetical protein